MKKVISLLIAVYLFSSFFATSAVSETYENDMRAVWVSTIYNSDYPKTKNNVQIQKQEFIDKLDVMKSVGMNTAIVQIRPKGDALYKSNINPWSEVLTGTQGKDPRYDPLKFMIDETHKKNMSFHAWLNPYRITTSGTDLTKLSENHPARIHPDWVLVYNNALYYNPDLKEVKEHVRDTVNEIINNYDVDGIHFDDYFYPSDFPLPEHEDKDGAVANKRRENINEMIEMVSTAIKNNKPDVQFGVSPMGVWKNSSSDKTGSNTNGKEAYYSVFSDSRNWIQNGIIDYIVPQIYWETGHKLADYETLVKWWSNEVKGTNVKLYIGQGLYKDVISKEIGTQLEINKKYSEVKGSVFFSLKDLETNRENCKTRISSIYGGNSVIDSSTITIEKPSVEVVEKPVKPVAPVAPVTKPVSGNKVNAVVTNSKIIVNEKVVEFEAYNIDGSNYFKLRDVASAVNGTGKQFDTLWDDSSQAINIITATPYKYTNDKGISKAKGNKMAIVSTAKLLLDGTEISSSAYNIDGNNYFKLRDIGFAVNFGVIWDNDTNTVEIDTFIGYETNN